MSILSRQNHNKKRPHYSYFLICKYNERLATVRRRFGKRCILTKMDNKRINWRFAGTANKGYPFDSLLRQIAETADFKSGKRSEDRREDGEGGEKRGQAAGAREEDAGRQRGEEKETSWASERLSLDTRRSAATGSQWPNNTLVSSAASFASFASPRFASPRLAWPRLASLGLAARTLPGFLQQQSQLWLLRVFFNESVAFEESY